MENKDFGALLKEMRLKHGMSMTKAAKAAGISAPYLSDIEKGRKAAPSRDTLHKIIRALKLDENEEVELCELAGKMQNTIAYDLPEYIMDRDYVSAALRTAKNVDAGEEVWKKFVDELLAKGGGTNDSSNNSEKG